jgi:hypothetical protein
VGFHWGESNTRIGQLTMFQSLLTLHGKYFIQIFIANKLFSPAFAVAVTDT